MAPGSCVPMCVNMPEIEQRKLDNFINVGLGLKYCVDGLHDFIIETFRNEHNSIRLRITSQCTVNCSRRHGSVFQQWCPVCVAWKDELFQLCTSRLHYSRINWTEIDTRDFFHCTPLSFEAIARVFVHDPKTYTHGLFLDFGAVMSLFRNMDSFNTNVDRNLIQRISMLRNTLFAHNYTLQLEEREKKTCITTLISLLRAPSITHTQSAQQAVLRLQELKQCNGIPHSLLRNTELVAFAQNVLHNSSSRDRRNSNIIIQRIIQGVEYYQENNVPSIGRRDDIRSQRRVRGVIRPWRTKGTISWRTKMLIIVMIFIGLFPLKLHEKKKETKGT